MNAGEDARAAGGITGAQLRQKLLDLARRRREEPGSLLARYAFERLLYRIGRSEVAEAFEMHGTELRVAWPGEPGTVAEMATLKQSLRTICRARVDVPDGVAYLPAALRARRGAGEGSPLRIDVDATVADARVHLGFQIGLARSPRPEVGDCPTLLDLPAPRLRREMPEPLVAGKILDLLVPPSGAILVDDFFGVWQAAAELEFSGKQLCRLLVDGFAARQRGLPLLPFEAMRLDGTTRSQWRRLAAGVPPARRASTLRNAIREVNSFVLPLLDAVQSQGPFERVWPPGGPWRSAR